MTDIEEAPPAECRAIALAELDAAREADSLDHMLMHLRSATIWAKGATFPLTRKPVEVSIEFAGDKAATYATLVEAASNEVLAARQRRAAR